MNQTEQQLSDNQRALLAREVAADKYENGSHFGPQREAFRAGWNAALAWSREQRSILPIHFVCEDCHHSSTTICTRCHRMFCHDHAEGHAC